MCIKPYSENTSLKWFSVLICKEKSSLFIIIATQWEFLSIPSNRWDPAVRRVFSQIFIILLGEHLHNLASVFFYWIKLCFLYFIDNWRISIGGCNNTWFCSTDGENVPRSHANEESYNKPIHHTVINNESSVIKSGIRAESSTNEDYVSPPKYKSSLLHRYLNDSLRHVMATNAAMREKTRQRNHSGSFSSNEFEEELVSPSSSETEGNFVYRTGEAIHSILCIPSR